MLFWIKVLVSSLVIAGASHLAGRKPMLAGLVVAFPIISMLSLIWAYVEHRDMRQLNDFAISILVAVPLSLTFFIPFLANRWLKMNFFMTFTFGILCLSVAYGLSYYLARKY